MFADDTSIWVASGNVPDLLHLLRDETALLEKWIRGNILTYLPIMGGKNINVVSL